MEFLSAGAGFKKRVESGNPAAPDFFVRIQERLRALNLLRVATNQAFAAARLLGHEMCSRTVMCFWTAAHDMS